MDTDWKNVDEVARFLGERLGSPPHVLAVLGSGLGGMAAGLDDARSISTREVPGWPASTVAGHAGKLHRGRIGNVEMLVQEGRVHLYEGYAAAEVVRPIRAAIAWGARTIVLTNAAGAVNPALRPGELMVVEDHLNLTGENPLVGPNDEARGPRFPDMSAVYDPSLRALTLDKAGDVGVTLRTGVYAGLRGPSYETPAEVRMLAALGAHAVGMSTVLEAVAARHMGARVLGVSCISNLAAGLCATPQTHAEVQAVAARAADDLARLLAAMAVAMGGRT
ncbi:MAG: purine-nucleoside phosphorylase [Deltaproteobacteria bacterium]|nr:purine-nucleoside phosphorylase [Deltaproteobacteria bacterium]